MARSSRPVEAAQALAVTVRELLATGLPALRDTATRAAVEVGLSGPQTTAECFATVTLLNMVGATLVRFGPEVWAAPLDDMVAATADRAWRTSPGSTVACWPGVDYAARPLTCSAIRVITAVCTRLWPLHGTSSRPGETCPATVDRRVLVHI